MEISYRISTKIWGGVMGRVRGRLEENRVGGEKRRFGVGVYRGGEMWTRSL